MKLWINILAQVVGILGSSATLVTSYVPEKYKPLVVLGITLVQGVVGVVAHQYNPDGTSSKVAYTPPPKP